MGTVVWKRKNVTVSDEIVEPRLEKLWNAVAQAASLSELAALMASDSVQPHIASGADQEFVGKTRKPDSWVKSASPAPKSGNES